ncbi:MAG: hypothetical protein ACRC4N_13390, partial [Gammaproteobacteria bacterium]
MPKQSHRQTQLAMKNKSSLKITSTQTSQAAAQDDNEQADGLLEKKVSEKFMSGSSEYHTDSTISDQEQESIKMSTWTTATELDLNPVSFNENLDHHSTKTAFYP